MSHAGGSHCRVLDDSDSQSPQLPWWGLTVQSPWKEAMLLLFLGSGAWRFNITWKQHRLPTCTFLSVSPRSHGHLSQSCHSPTSPRSLPYWLLHSWNSYTFRLLSWTPSSLCPSSAWLRPHFCYSKLQLLATVVLLQLTAAKANTKLPNALLSGNVTHQIAHSSIPCSTQFCPILHNNITRMTSTLVPHFCLSISRVAFSVHISITTPITTT